MKSFLAGADERFDIAITVDDLPLHGALSPGMTRLGIARSALEDTSPDVRP